MRNAEWKKQSFRIPNSKFRIHQARQYLVGGVNSPVRAFRRVGGSPLILRSGRGAWVTDVKGRRYLDLIMGWGALVFGHNHPQALKAVRQQLSRGTLLGLTTALEGQLAQAIGEAIPSIERVRFTPSGTEACMTAIRLARAWTKRSKVLSFEGCYHGHSDGLLACLSPSGDGGQVKRGPACADPPARGARAGASVGRSGLATFGLAGSAGVPSSIAQETIVVPYNDAPALEEAMSRFGQDVACAIIEPIAANMGVVVPEQAFLQGLREMTTRHGTVLIFDEVVTGFRLRYGGRQTSLGIAPDLTVLGKIIGGGFPIGAVGGRADLMEQLAPIGPVYHAGTFAGHPIAMAAGLATLQTLRQQHPYERLEAMGDQLASGLRAAAQEAGVAVQVNQVGSMLTAFFHATPVRRFTDVQQAGARQFAAFANSLRSQGVLIPPSPFETWFLSTAHTAVQIERIIEAARKIYGQLTL